jgi:hypothetical protein
VHKSCEFFSYIYEGPRYFPVVSLQYTESMILFTAKKNLISMTSERLSKIKQ